MSIQETLLFVNAMNEDPVETLAPDPILLSRPWEAGGGKLKVSPALRFTVNWQRLC